MSVFTQTVTKIKGLSDRRRLPRLGSIRLGLKVRSQKTGKEYPRETEYFVCPPEIRDVYGDQPKELDVMVPINDIEAVFPTAYKYYGSSKGLKCQGNGEIAYRVNKQTKEMEEFECPCELLEAGKCKQSATLMVMIPKVSVGGIYMLRTSSYNSIVDIASGLDYVSALLGRFAMVPLTLRRVKTETHHDEKKQYHYTMQITFDGNIETLNQLRADTQRVLEHPRYQLPAPRDENPELEPVDIIEDEEQPNGNDDRSSDKSNGKSSSTKPDPKKSSKPSEITAKEKRIIHSKMVEAGLKAEQQIAFFDWMNIKTTEEVSICIDQFDTKLAQWQDFLKGNGESKTSDPPNRDEEVPSGASEVGLPSNEKSDSGGAEEAQGSLPWDNEAVDRSEGSSFLTPAMLSDNEKWKEEIDNFLVILDTESLIEALKPWKINNIVELTNAQPIHRYTISQALSKKVDEKNIDYK